MIIVGDCAHGRYVTNTCIELDRRVRHANSWAVLSPSRDDQQHGEEDTLEHDERVSKGASKCWYFADVDGESTSEGELVGEFISQL